MVRRVGGASSNSGKASRPETQELNDETQGQNRLISQVKAAEVKEVSSAQPFVLFRCSAD